MHSSSTAKTRFPMPARFGIPKIYIDVTTKAHNLISGHFMNYVAKLKQLPKNQAWFPALSVLFLPRCVNNLFFHWISSCLRKGPTCYWSALQTRHGLFERGMWDSNEGSGYVLMSSHVYKIARWTKHSWVEFWCTECSKTHAPVRLEVKIRRATPCYVKSCCLVRREICTTSSL